MKIMPILMNDLTNDSFSIDTQQWLKNLLCKWTLNEIIIRLFGDIVDSNQAF